MKADVSLTTAKLRTTSRSYSPEEVFAARGALAFGRKSGKNNETLIRALENSPAEPFTDEEWDALMAQLQNDK